jgi:hypothetical protein
MLRWLHTDFFSEAFSLLASYTSGDFRSFATSSCIRSSDFRSFVVSRCIQHSNETMPQLYFAPSGFQIALDEAWHSPTLRCHAFSITASLLCAACGLEATSSLLSFEESRLQTALSAFFSFSSYSVLWLLKFRWSSVFSSYSVLWLLKSLWLSGFQWQCASSAAYRTCF